MGTYAPSNAGTLDSDGRDSVPYNCCGERFHPWDEFAVATNWFPEPLRCLIVGESPGDVESVYFYDVHRQVAIRTVMLRELSRHSLIRKPDLSAFKAAGLLFDHAIRCRLDGAIIRDEADRAKRYNSARAASATHLRQHLQQKPRIWVMGYLARNAIADLCRQFPRDSGKISKPPYPCKMPKAPRFFVSRYLLHASAKEVAEIFRRLHCFLDKSASKSCVTCNNP